MKQARTRMVWTGVRLSKSLPVIMLLSMVALLVDVSGTSDNEESSSAGTLGLYTPSREMNMGSPTKFWWHGFPDNKEKERKVDDSKLREFVENAMEKSRKERFDLWEMENGRYIWQERGKLGQNFHALLLVSWHAAPESPNFEDAGPFLNTEELKKAGSAGELQRVAELTRAMQLRHDSFVRSEGRKNVPQILQETLTFITKNSNRTMWQILGETESTQLAHRIEGPKSALAEDKTIGLYITEESIISLNGASHYSIDTLWEVFPTKGDEVLLLSGPEMARLFHDTERRIHHMLLADDRTQRDQAEDRTQRDYQSLPKAEWRSCVIGSCVTVKYEEQSSVRAVMDGPLVELVNDNAVYILGRLQGEVVLGDVKLYQPLFGACSGVNTVDGAAAHICVTIEMTNDEEEGSHV